MATVLCYTKPGVGNYPDFNYPGCVGRLCDWEKAMHLAFSQDGETFTPLRNHTGILFARATRDEGDPRGTTKVLTEPWLVRKADGSFLVLALRENRDGPDPKVLGCVMLFDSPDLVHFSPERFLRLSDRAIAKPRCMWDVQSLSYVFEWEEEDGTHTGRSRDLTTLTDAGRRRGVLRGETRTFGIPDCVPGNCLEVTEAELKVIRGYLDEIRHVSVLAPEMHLRAGDDLTGFTPGKATCLYSDGSTHDKLVDWDREALSAVKSDVPGVYTVPGTIRPPLHAFPIPLNFGQQDVRRISDPNILGGMSDPCVTWYRGRYYLSSTGNQHIVLRCADRIQDVFAAEPVVIADVPLDEGERFRGTWAAELHEIGGRLCLLTALCPGGDWTRVHAAVLVCHGEPLDKAAWDAPRNMVRRDGTILQDRGISLDMTYFRDGGRDYVMWSDRVIELRGGERIVEPADIRIATIDPEHPWQLTSDVSVVMWPMYGWDRMETEVDEGPYLLRHGDDLFVTVSGSSTGMGDLYDLGLLHAKSGEDLLDPDVWEETGYPLLTKESVPGEYGPGHNNFVEDRETGDIIMIYHAIPHDGQDRTLRRQPGIRRLHFAATGLPYLEMTPERDLAPGLERVEAKIVIEA